MNISSILGFFIAATVLGYAIVEAKGASSVLLNPHAAMIVFGGTCAASFICFPLSRIARMSFLAFKKLLGMAGQDYEKIIQEVIGVAEGLRTDPNHAKNSIEKIENPFFKEGLQLITDGVTEQQLLEIMEARIESIHHRYAAEVNMFKTIGRFPPAFGLLGTTFGMISLLNQLGSPDAQKLLGPAMAVGLVATLYGIALTNFVFIPISENLASGKREDLAARKMVLEGCVLIKRKVHPLLVEELMKSHLPPQDRMKLGKARGAKTRAAAQLS